MSNPFRTPELQQKAMAQFDEIIRLQGSFWCPICDFWFDTEKCETAVGSPFFNGTTNQMGVVIFAVCETCAVRRTHGIDLAEAAKEAIDERTARRAATGVPEPKDPRQKFLIKNA